jgi:glycosyltransferase involved in cell wall biosynthesis
VKLAFVHDWLTGMRGGEKVLEVLCERFPDAEVFTLVHAPGTVSPVIERQLRGTSFVQHLPFATTRWRHYLPLLPLATRQLNFDRFDMIVSVSHCCVKSVRHPPGTKHLCYCLTPMRYAWDQFDAYFGPERLGSWQSRLMRPVMGRLAAWDRATAARPDRYVAISRYVAARIRRYYNREASVVYPPVDTDFFRPADRAPERAALVVSALVPYKRVDLAIDACRRLRVPLTIVGNGPDRQRLERHAAGADVTFAGWVPAAQVRASYQRAGVVVLPGEEDFGIVPVEANACGRPVVALARGGALETVRSGVSGSLVDESDVDAFAGALGDALDRRWDPTAIRRHALHFARERFVQEIEALVRNTYDAPDGTRW